MKKQRKKVLMKTFKNLVSAFSFKMKFFAVFKFKNPVSVDKIANR